MRKTYVLRSKGERISLLIERRAVLVITGLFLLVMICAIAGTSIGRAC
jgi:iron complex transport system permease protein